MKKNGEHIIYESLKCSVVAIKSNRYGKYRLYKCNDVMTLE